MTLTRIAQRLGMTREAAREYLIREGVDGRKVKRTDTEGRPLPGRPRLEYDNDEVEALLRRRAAELRARAALLEGDE